MIANKSSPFAGNALASEIRGWGREISGYKETVGLQFLGYLLAAAPTHRRSSWRFPASATNTASAASRGGL
jgi:hypothetical protein